VKIAWLSALKDLEQNTFFRAPQFSSGYPVLHGSWFNPKINQLSSGSRFLVGWIDHNHKLIVFTSPKVGTTSLKHVTAIINENNKGTPILTTLEWTQKHGALHWQDFKNYKKFMPIRDPFDRYISFFEDKIVFFFQKLLENGLSSLKKGLLMNMAHYYSHHREFSEMTFAQTIDIIFKYYSEGRQSIWDTHLTKQITADFSHIAVNHVHFFDSIYLSNFLDQWLEKYAVPKQNTLYNKGTFATAQIKNAHQISLRDLCNLSCKPAKESYFNQELADKLHCIYNDDFKIYNRFKGTKPILF